MCCFFSWSCANSNDAILFVRCSALFTFPHKNQIANAFATHWKVGWMQNRYSLFSCWNCVASGSAWWHTTHSICVSHFYEKWNEPFVMHRLQFAQIHSVWVFACKCKLNDFWVNLGQYCRMHQSSHFIYFISQLI